MACAQQPYRTPTPGQPFPCHCGLRTHPAPTDRHCHRVRSVCQPTTPARGRAGPADQTTNQAADAGTAGAEPDPAAQAWREAGAPDLPSATWVRTVATLGCPDPRGAIGGFGRGIAARLLDRTLSGPARGAVDPHGPSSPTGHGAGGGAGLGWRVKGR